MNTVFRAAAQSEALRRLIELGQPWGLRLARLLGSTAGGLGYEIEDRNGRVVRLALVSDEQGHITPVAPAVLVAEALARGESRPSGIVPADRHVDPQLLVEYLERAGIEWSMQ